MPHPRCTRGDLRPSLLDLNSSALRVALAPSVPNRKPSALPVEGEIYGQGCRKFHIAREQSLLGWF